MRKRLNKILRKGYGSGIPDVHAESLDQGIERARNEFPHIRVVRLTCCGEIYFFKRVLSSKNKEEGPTSPTDTQLLDTEAKNLSWLREIGVPVPEIIARDSQFLVLSDRGFDLRQIFFSKDYDPEYGIKVCFEAGRALAGLHIKGISLGRGRPKDFCWGHNAISFIDFEMSPQEFDAETNGAANLWTFVFHLFRDFAIVNRDGYKEAQSFLSGYLENAHPAPLAAMKAAGCWAKQQRWRALHFKLVAVVAPLHMSSRYRAMSPALRMFKHFHS